MSGKIKKVLGYFSVGEKVLWSVSVVVIVASFCIFDRVNYLTLFTSIIGVTSLVFNSKGNPIGQALMIVFSALYGVISYSFRYYGEMITYLGMTAPMAVFALVTWLKNPYKGNKSEVKVNTLKPKEYVLMLVLTAIITGAFYFVLRAFDTSYLVLSTVSVATSFIAVYLTFRRSPLYALGYACNDIVLIALWTLATLQNTEYLSVTICFAVFWVNDLYGFISWRKMSARQKRAEE